MGDGAPYQRHSATSKAAAAFASAHAETWLRRVYDAIDAAGPRGLTDEEAQDLLRLNASTQRPRRVTLVDAGRVYDSGLTRLTRSGRKATVWIATRHRDPQTGFRW